MRSGQNRLAPRNKKKFPKNCSLIFGEFRLISEGVGSVPAVYQFLSVEQKIQSDFCPTLIFFLNESFKNFHDFSSKNEVGHFLFDSIFLCIMRSDGKREVKWHKKINK